MNPVVLLLILTSLIAFVVGQLLLKHAMDATVGRFRRNRFLLNIIGGTGTMAVSYFLNLGLLQKLELSYLYPFQGLTVIFISAAAAIWLRERLTPPLMIGSLLITAGVVLVSLS